MKSLLIQYFDLLWLVAAFIVAAGNKRLKAMLLVGICLGMVRLQAELFIELRLPYGLLNIMDSAVLLRGQVTYSVFIALFLLLSRLSYRTNPFIYVAAGITIFVLAFCTSSIIMLL